MRNELEESVKEGKIKNLKYQRIISTNAHKE